MVNENRQIQLRGEFSQVRQGAAEEILFASNQKDPLGRKSAN